MPTKTITHVAFINCYSAAFAPNPPSTSQSSPKPAPYRPRSIISTKWPFRRSSPCCPAPSSQTSAWSCPTFINPELPYRTLSFPVSRCISPCGSASRPSAGPGASWTTGSSPGFRPSISRTDLRDHSLGCGAPPSCCCCSSAAGGGASILWVSYKRTEKEVSLGSGVPIVKCCSYEGSFFER